MSIKIALLSTQEQIISDVREMVSGDNVVAYVFNNPHKLSVQTPILLEEDKDDFNDNRSVQVSLTPWILVTSDKDVPVSPSNVVALVEPLTSVREMYEEKVNADD